MSTVERFEDLRIWQESRVLANEMYGLTKAMNDFPFRDQLRSAAISTMNNIAEGFERRTDADFAHFLDIAKGSSAEVRSMLYLGEDLRYVPAIEAVRLRTLAHALSGGIGSFSGYLRRGKR